MALPSVIAGLSLVPEIVEGVSSIVSLFGRTGPISAGPTGAQAGLLSGGTAGSVLSTGATIAGGRGTSIGPATAIDVGITALPVIARAIQPVVARIAGQPGAGLAAGVPGAGPRQMTRKQFILLTARANNPGATAKKIIRSARECGIELAAATFGLSVLDVCFLIAQPPTRRSRGISAADIRRTRATMRKVNGLKSLCPPARRRSK